MDVCTTEDPEHVSHDAPSPHYAALHTHGGSSEPDENGLMMLGVGYYERDKLDAGA